MKFIKKLICKIFHIKACQCPEEMDEHIEFYTKSPEPEVPVDVEPCNLHRYFKARCGYCQAFAKAQKA